MSSPLTARFLSWGKASREAQSAARTASAAACSLSDEELLAQLRSKDEAALVELFDRHARLVFGIAFRILEDRGEAEELVQELFLHLMARADRFDPMKGPGRAWISHLAVHKAIDRRGFLKRRRFYDGTDLQTVEDSLQGGDDIEAALLRDSLGGQLRRALEELPARQRITLEWFFFEGCTLGEIGERLAESHFNVRHHFYRGLEKLRRSPIIVRLKGDGL